MKLSEIIIKIIAIALIIVGFMLVLASLGIANFIVVPQPEWLGILIGLVLIGASVVLIRGGNITL